MFQLSTRHSKRQGSEFSKIRKIGRTTRVAKNSSRRAKVIKIPKTLKNMTSSRTLLVRKYYLKQLQCRKDWPWNSKTAIPTNSKMIKKYIWELWTPIKTSMMKRLSVMVRFQSSTAANRRRTSPMAHLGYRSNMLIIRVKAHCQSRVRRGPRWLWVWRIKPLCNYKWPSNKKNNCGNWAKLSQSNRSQRKLLAAA